MKPYLNNCTFYILLWGIYYLQGTLYPSGSIISQGVLALIMLISLYYCFKVNITYKLPIFMRVLNVFLVVLSVYGMLFMLSPTQVYFENIISTPATKHEYLKTIYMSLLPIYVMYHYGRRGVLTTSYICRFTILWLFIVIVQFIRLQNDAMAAASEMGITEDIEIVNNIAYDFLHLFPLIFLWRAKPFVQYLLTAVIFAFILVGMKRGVIVIGAVCLMWFLYSIWRTSKGRQRYAVAFLTIVLLSLGIGYISDLYSTSPLFQQRIEQTLEGSTSNRDTIYGSLWQYFKDDLSLTHFLLGNGAFFTVTVAGNFAHNDWLELLINQGLLGVAIYIAYFISLVYTLYRLRHNKQLYAIMAMIVFIMFASSLFSMSYSSLGLPIAMGLGYCLSATNQSPHNHQQ